MSLTEPRQMPARVYLCRLLELRRALYEADTESQFRARWVTFATVRANALSAHPHLHI